MDSPSVFCEVSQLALPRTSIEKPLLHLLIRLGKFDTQKLMRDIPAGFGGRPSVSFLRPSIPEQNHAIHVADHDRVVSELQEFSLFPQILNCSPFFGAIFYRQKYPVVRTILTRYLAGIQNERLLAYT